MLLERLLVLATGAIVAIAVGIGLVMMAAEPASTDLDDVSADPASAGAEIVAAAPAEPAPPSSKSRAEARAEIEAILAAAPEYALFFERLRTLFPSDYESAIERFSADRLAGKAEASVDFYLSEMVRELRQSRGVLASKAEAGPLTRVFDVQLELLRAIASQNRRLCVAFLYGGVDQEFHDFAAGKRSLVAEMATAGLEAISSGQTKKVERALPSEADFRALETALAGRGLSKVEIDALLDGKTPEPPLDDGAMCAAGQTYLEVLRTLPEPIRLRIYGLAIELMARS
jgi:hypothetical protein